MIERLQSGDRFFVDDRDGRALNVQVLHSRGWYEFWEGVADGKRVLVAVKPNGDTTVMVKYQEDAL